jgi:hypothetical protein
LQSRAGPKHHTGGGCREARLHVLRVRARRIFRAVHGAVRRDEIRSPFGEITKECITGDVAEIENTVPPKTRPSIRRSAHHGRDGAPVVGQTRQHGCDTDAHTNSGLREPAHDDEPLRRRRDRWFDLTGKAGIERRQADANRDAGARRIAGEDVEVAQDESGARDEVHADAGARQFSEDRASDPVAALDRLVGVGCRADRDVVDGTSGPREFAPQHCRGVDLGRDSGAPFADAVEFAVCVRGPGVAEDALVRAAGVRIDRPAERHPPDAVEKALRGDFRDSDLGRPARNMHRTYVRFSGFTCLQCNLAPVT